MKIQIKRTVVCTIHVPDHLVGEAATEWIKGEEQAAESELFDLLSNWQDALAASYWQMTITMDPNDVHILASQIVDTE